MKNNIIIVVFICIFVVLGIFSLLNNNRPESKIDCYNSDGKIVYTEIFPNGTDGNFIIEAKTNDGRKVWIYTGGSLMCREEETLNGKVKNEFS